jgi:hypothetical protein
MDKISIENNFSLIDSNYIEIFNNISSDLNSSNNISNLNSSDNISDIESGNSSDSDTKSETMSNIDIFEIKSNLLEINKEINESDIVELVDSEESEDSLKSYDSFDTKDENILKKEIIKTKLLLLKQKNEKEKKDINILKNKEYNDLLVEMLEDKQKSKEKCLKSKEIKQIYKKENVTKIIIDNDDDYLHKYKFF